MKFLENFEEFWKQQLGILNRFLRNFSKLKRKF